MGLIYEKFQPAAGDTVRQVAKLQQGIPSEKAKEIVKIIKNSKLRKVQASIQADQVRITSSSRDELQEVIKMLKRERSESRDSAAIYELQVELITAKTLCDFVLNNNHD